MKPSAYYFYVKMKTLVDFHICISVFGLNGDLAAIKNWAFHWEISFNLDLSKPAQGLIL